MQRRIPFHITQNVRLTQCFVCPTSDQDVLSLSPGGNAECVSLNHRLVPSHQGTKLGLAQCGEDSMGMGCRTLPVSSPQGDGSHPRLGEILCHGVKAIDCHRKPDSSWGGI